MESQHTQSSVPPIVSIGMPVYNDVKFIREAIESLLSQTFGNFELIISDDFSTDGSADVCLEYARKDSRIRYIRQPYNIGIARNMEVLLKEARGEFFMWAADDDVWHRDFIKKMYEAICSNPSASCAFCSYYYIDEDSSPMIGRGIVSKDYSNPSKFVRLIKLCKYYEDGFGYGLFRRKLIEQVKYPTWWGINSKSAINIIYPPLFYFLSVGDYIHASHIPLWFDRLKNKSPHYIPFKNKRVKGKLAFFLRKVNVLYESARNIYRGTNSIGLVVSVLPALFARFLYDCSWFFLIGPLKRRFRRVFSSKFDKILAL
jgi:glycosyltransferase involved in cell wall biosynthesis